MKSKRILIGAVAAAALVLSSMTTTTPAAQGATGNPVTTWNQIAVTTLVGLPGPAGGAPSAAPIHVAMVQGAVYDAVNAITPKHYRPYLLNRRFAANASKDAAVATAAYGVLRNIVSTVPNFDPAPGEPCCSRWRRSTTTRSPRIPEGSSKKQGINAGNAAAEAMIAARQDDGRFGPSQWVPNSAAGHWQPLITPTGPPSIPRPGSVGWRPS